MKTIAIIDDEYYFRQTLKKYISEYKDEFKVVGEAFNGITGIELVNNLSPDIILLDISMPQKDGFDVITEALKQNKKLHFIIISGYDKFEYAQRSIKLGVVDFLLKPITKTDLYDCLNKVSNEIDNSRKITQTLTDLTQKEYRSKDYLTFTFFQKLIHSKPSIIEIQQITKDIQFKVDDSCFIPIVLYIKNRNSIEMDAKTLELYAFAISNIFNEQLLPNDIQSISSSDGKYIYILTSIPAETTDTIDMINNALNSFISVVNRNNGLSMSITTVYHSGSIEELSNSFSNLLLLQKYCIFYSLEGIFAYEETKARMQKTIPVDSFNSNRVVITKCLKDNNYSEVIKTSQQMFDIVMREKPDPECFLIQFKAIISDLSYLANEYNIQQYINTNLRTLEKCISFRDIRGQFTELINSITRIIGDPVQPSNHITVIKVRNYIKEHYSDPDLSSNSLSKTFNLKEQHLCFLFKKHTDITIGNYILRIRMQAAKRLLDESNYNISEISTQIGYNDAGYFSKCFKKYFDVSPKQYITQKNKSAAKVI